MQYLSFCEWLVTFIILSSGFIHLLLMVVFLLFSQMACRNIKSDGKFNFLPKSIHQKGKLHTCCCQRSLEIFRITMCLRALLHLCPFLRLNIILFYEYPRANRFFFNWQSLVAQVFLCLFVLWFCMLSKNSLPGLGPHNCLIIFRNLLQFCILYFCLCSSLRWGVYIGFFSDFLHQCLLSYPDFI
jgi:hypothetical protein